MMSIQDQDAQEFLEIKKWIDQARTDALKSVNIHLIQLYWKIGGCVSKKLSDAAWGDKTVEKLAVYLNRSGPDYKGFNRRNLYRMRQFFEAYPDHAIVSSLLTQLSWTNNLLILSKTKTDEERQFYLSLATKERYSTRELERQHELFENISRAEGSE